MPVRHFLLYTLFPLLLAAALPARSQTTPPPVPKSVWWYPLGDMEGTRRNITPNEKIQRDSDVVVKWRSPLLGNAPVLLVGAIRANSTDTTQQVVGILNDTAVAIISSDGLLQLVYSYKQDLVNAFVLRLCGLFDKDARLPDPHTSVTGRPNRIGIGIEREQPDLSTPLFGVLADSAGHIKSKLEVSAVKGSSPASTYTGVYPVAVYSMATTGITALAAVSQLRYDGSQGAPANGLRGYVVSTSTNTAVPSTNYPIAPRAYAQPPAITVGDLTSNDSTFIALSTASYSFAPVTVTPPAALPVAGVPTRSDSMYSIELKARTDSIVHVNTRAVPLPAAGAASSQGEAHSYFVTLYPSPTRSADRYLLTAENHSAAAPGKGRLILTSALHHTDSLFGSFADPDLDMSNLGWTIVAADIDAEYGAAQQNHGDEILAAWSDPNGGDLEENWLYALARTEGPGVSVKPAGPFGYFARQFFSGRLLCAGDLVGATSGGNQQQLEILTSHGDTLNILELLSYDDANYGEHGDRKKSRYFTTIKSFVLDSPIRYAAIADLENDGLNDIIVSTQSSTYAIGRRVPKPFGTIQSDSQAYCHGRDVTISWNRRVGGGEGGVQIYLKREEEEAVKIRDGFIDKATHNALNRGAGADAISLADAAIAPGRYRVVISDPFVPSLTDTSNWFTINAPAFNAVTLDTGSASPDFGGQVTLGTRVGCSDGLVALRSYDGVTWDTVRTVDAIGDSVTAHVPLVCPSGGHCGFTASVTARLRFSDINGYGESETKELTIPIAPHTLALDSGASDPRRRVVSWSAGDYGCSSPHIVLIDSVTDSVLYEFPQAPAGVTNQSLLISDAYSGRVYVRICCEDGDCHYGKTATFELPPPAPDSMYVAPNPFDPNARGDIEGARIVYRLATPGNVTVTIYDAGRAIVLRLTESQAQNAGTQRLIWNGRNSQGDIVASGTYICTIVSSSGQRFVLPIIVSKH